MCKQVSSKSPVVPTAKKAAAHRAIPKTKAHPKEASASKAAAAAAASAPKAAAAAAASAPKAAAAASDGASAPKAEKKKRPPTEHAMMVGKLMRQGLSPEHFPPFLFWDAPPASASVESRLRAGSCVAVRARCQGRGALAFWCGLLRLRSQRRQKGGGTSAAGPQTHRADEPCREGCPFGSGR